MVEYYTDELTNKIAPRATHTSNGWRVGSCGSSFHILPKTVKHEWMWLFADKSRKFKHVHSFKERLRPRTSHGQCTSFTFRMLIECICFFVRFWDCCHPMQAKTISTISLYLVLSGWICLLIKLRGPGQSSLQDSITMFQLFIFMFRIFPVILMCIVACDSNAREESLQRILLHGCTLLDNWDGCRWSVLVNLKNLISERHTWNVASTVRRDAQRKCVMRAERNEIALVFTDEFRIFANVFIVTKTRNHDHTKQWFMRSRFRLRECGLWPRKCRQHGKQCNNNTTMATPLHEQYL